MVLTEEGITEEGNHEQLMEKKGIKVFRYTDKELKPIKQACVGIWDELGKRGLTPELMKGLREHLGK